MHKKRFSLVCLMIQSHSKFQRSEGKEMIEKATLFTGIISLLIACTPTYQGHQLIEPPFAMTDPIGRFWVDEAKQLTGGSPVKAQVVSRSLDSFKSDNWWSFGATLQADATQNLNAKAGVAASDIKSLSISGVSVLTPSSFEKINRVPGNKVAVSAIRADKFSLTFKSGDQIDAGAKTQLTQSALGTDVNFSSGSSEAHSGTGLIIGLRLIQFAQNQQELFKQQFTLALSLSDIGNGYAVRLKPQSSPPLADAYCHDIEVQTPLIRDGQYDVVTTPICLEPVDSSGEKAIFRGGKLFVSFVLQGSAIDSGEMDLSKVEFNYILDPTKGRHLNSVDGNATYTLKRHVFKNANF